jgi:valyl-tRNA synthetase
MLAALAEVVQVATQAFENYDHTKALETTETFFWTFTDDYLELVKERAYASGDQTPQAVGSAVIALREALSILVRLFAPFIPFAAEEVWSWWQEGSVHLSPWPTMDEVGFQDATLMRLASETLVMIRKTKSDAKVSMKAELDRVVLAGPATLQALAEDLKAVGKISELELRESETLKIESSEFKPEELQ